MLAVLAGGGCSRDQDEGRSDVPYNVVLVTLDTTRADHLSCYGHTTETSPNFDALAREGARFDSAIAQAASTPVSHASIFTGLNPYQHGVRVIYAASGYRLAGSIPTLTTVLKERGWHTGAFLSSFTVSEFYGFDRGFDVFDNGLHNPADQVLTEGEEGNYRWDLRLNQRRSDQTTARAVEWLGEAKRPFYLWVHYWDPHDPYEVPPAEVLARFMRAPRGSEAGQRQRYDAEIFFMDAQFGRLVQVLKEMGQYDRTIIVVVGDHGQGLGDHGWDQHRILYQEQLHVPLILRIPGGARGRVVSQLVRTIDIFPTVLEALGISTGSTIEGRSLLGLMAGETDSPRIAYADALNLYDLNAKSVQTKRPQDDLVYCAMDRQWKLIYRPRHPDKNELYNLRDDPGELHNLYGRESTQAERLLAALKEFDGFVDQPFGEGTDAEALERLRAMGYVLNDNDSGE
ncbi:MAG TPA: sulfatase [Phycisphaerae bacterium]|nr:sulfatase [Phycisphaerae bacterium]